MGWHIEHILISCGAYVLRGIEQAIGPRQNNAELFERMVFLSQCGTKGEYYDTISDLLLNENTAVRGWASDMAEPPIAAGLIKDCSRMNPEFFGKACLHADTGEQAHEKSYAFGGQELSLVKAVRGAYLLDRVDLKPYEIREIYSISPSYHAIDAASRHAFHLPDQRKRPRGTSFSPFESIENPNTPEAQIDGTQTFETPQTIQRSESLISFDSCGAARPRKSRSQYRGPRHGSQRHGRGNQSPLIKLSQQDELERQLETREWALEIQERELESRERRVLLDFQHAQLVRFEAITQLIREGRIVPPIDANLLCQPLVPPSQLAAGQLPYLGGVTNQLPTQSPFPIQPTQPTAYTRPNDQQPAYNQFQANSQHLGSRPAAQRPGDNQSNTDSGHSTHQ
ncbi:hypothetical protein BDV18DRAFT_162594 [Aspergillus unguis]